MNLLEHVRLCLLMCGLMCTCLPVCMWMCLYLYSRAEQLRTSAQGRSHKDTTCLLTHTTVTTIGLPLILTSRNKQAHTHQSECHCPPCAHPSEPFCKENILSPPCLLAMVIDKTEAKRKSLSCLFIRFLFSFSALVGHSFKNQQCYLQIYMQKQ